MALLALLLSSSPGQSFLIPPFTCLLTSSFSPIPPARHTMSDNITSQTAVWLMYLGRTRYRVAPGGLTLDMVVEVVRESAASQGRQFILNDPESWMIRDPLGPVISVAALSGPRPCDATFCFRCVRTWRSTPLGSGLPCEYPRRRPNQIKCAHCSVTRHPCLPVRVFVPFPSLILLTFLAPP